jgi:DNA polymerase-3 subunit gamma/tau
MVLVRLAYTADLPTPDDIVRAIGGGTATPGGQRAAPPKPAPERRPLMQQGAPAEAPDEEGSEDESGLGDLDEGLDEPGPAAAGIPMLRTFAEVVDYAGSRREAKLKIHLEEHVSLVKFDPAGSIELHLLPGAPKELANELREKLNAWTDRRWMVAVSRTPGERPIGEVAREKAQAEIREIEKHPAVAAILQEFPDARVTSVKPLPGAKKDETGTG